MKWLCQKIIINIKNLFRKGFAGLGTHRFCKPLAAMFISVYDWNYEMKNNCSETQFNF